MIRGNPGRVVTFSYPVFKEQRPQSVPLRTHEGCEWRSRQDLKADLLFEAPRQPSGAGHVEVSSVKLLKASSSYLRSDLLSQFTTGPVPCIVN